MTDREQHRFSRDLFEIENARTMNRDELVATFVPTKSFWRLLSAKNHVVLGTRGSGKTALVKMMSHDHLSKLDEPRAQSIIRSRAFIGVYVPTRLEWVGGLKNKPWQTEQEAELYFQWKLNIASCLAFLTTVNSCITTYITRVPQRLNLERKLAQSLSEEWLESSEPSNTLVELRRELERVEYRKQRQMAKQRALGAMPASEAPTGITFDMDLFIPLQRGIALANSLLKFPDEATWLVCLDEAEFLSTMHHRILNSHMRAYSGKIVFKITTMPYCHYTLDTNTSVPLDVGNDFEYIYIDRDPVVTAGSKEHEGHFFAVSMFDKRAMVSGRKYAGLRLDRLLGPSVLLDPKPGDWPGTSEMMALLRKYASPETVDRAERLHDQPDRFRDQISRKIHSALLLRDAVAQEKGRGELEVFSGYSMAIRCGDGNPRRLVRIFNRLLVEGRWKSKAEQNVDSQVPLLPPREQSRILQSFSSSVLTRLQSEPRVGPLFYNFIRDIGEYMRHCLHEEPLTTDQITSVAIAEDVDERTWLLVRRAVMLGLLYPNINSRNPDSVPYKKGTFHLAYILAPVFRLLPRRGKSRDLKTIKQFSESQRRGTIALQETFKFIREPIDEEYL
jgi:hypothetical protein